VAAPSVVSAWPSAIPTERGDCRTLTASVSCGQEIAGTGLQPWDDRRIHGQFGCLWCQFLPKSLLEAGLVGQVLYLEAEEAGSVRLGLAATSMIRFTRCSASLRAIGRASTISLSVVQSRTDALPHCLRTIREKQMSNDGIATVGRIIWKFGLCAQFGGQRKYSCPQFAPRRTLAAN